MPGSGESVRSSCVPGNAYPERRILMKKQTLQTLCTAALISLGLSFTAMGEERITDVSLIFSYDQRPEGGKEVGELTAVSSNSQFTVEGSG